jgi:outer membrane protein assembly factor BamE (lipoprotein component of BamABCDE complex)|tara:strand:- start:39 stop:491 length:453 start_codon:yes stop_codon:yes gene_type:complete
MKKIFILLIFLFTLNCSINKVSNVHGFRLLETKYNKIELNKSNKNDIRKLIGPPSSISKFEDMWIYIERKKTNQSLLKLGKKKLSRNNILILEFNKRGLVAEKKLLDINDMKDLEIAEKKTIKKFRQDNYLYDIFTTLREKINAPTRRKK